MKIIFLDIDGVIWTGNHDRIVRNLYEDSYSHMDDFDPKTVEQLNRILSTDPQIHIVISSSWRLSHTLDWLKEHFESQGFVFADKIIGTTPELINKERGWEIDNWLNNHPYIDKFVILDDDSDMVHLTPFLFKTSFYPGLTEAIANKIIKYFNENNNE